MNNNAAVCGDPLSVERLIPSALTPEVKVELAQSDSKVVASIVIPAHNEGAVIRRLLRSLPEVVDAGRLEVIVACNGCTDDTADIARRHGAKVVEISTPSKIAALNAADDIAVAYPRLYVD